MSRVSIAIACGSVVLLAWALSPLHAQTSVSTDGLTSIEGVRVGHHTLEGRPTGCTVVLTEFGAVATVDVRGAAPGTRSSQHCAKGACFGLLWW